VAVGQTEKQMLDTHGRAVAAPRPALLDVEFVRVELAPAIDGGFFVALTATTVDESEPQLLEQEIARDRVATIEAALVFINEHARLVFHSSTRKDN
jgi:hypothetical protein